LVLLTEPLYLPIWLDNFSRHSSRNLRRSALLSRIGAIFLVILKNKSEALKRSTDNSCAMPIDSFLTCSEMDHFWEPHNLKYLKGRELGSVYLWVFQHARYLFENMIVGADNNVLSFRGSSSGRTLGGDASLRGSHCTQQCR
jgi:hypothetical protein